MLDVFSLMAGRIPAVVEVGSEFPGAAGILSVPQCRLKAKGNFMIPSQSPWHRFWDPEKANVGHPKRPSTYNSENEHDIGKSPCSKGNTSSNGGSTVILVFGGGL